MSKLFISSKYVQGALQQSRDATAWFWAFWGMVILLIVGIDTHRDIVNKNQKILVPYNVATLDKSVKYSGDFSRPEDYLSLIAIADVHLWGDWRHSNVIQRMKRFKQRLSRDLLSKMSADLDFISSEENKNHIDQRIVIDGDVLMYTKNNKLRLPIRIYRTVLGVETPAKLAYLDLSYVNNEGVPLINSFEFQYVGAFK